jgi:hypothetical protein
MEPEGSLPRSRDPVLVEYLLWERRHDKRTIYFHEMNLLLVLLHHTPYANTKQSSDSDTDKELLCQVWWLLCIPVTHDKKKRGSQSVVCRPPVVLTFRSGVLPNNWDYKKNFEIKLIKITD